MQPPSFSSNTQWAPTGFVQGHIPIPNPPPSHGPSSEKWAWMRQDSLSTHPPDFIIPTAPDIPDVIQDKLKSGKGHAKMRSQLSQVDGEDDAAIHVKQIKLLEIC